MRNLPVRRYFYIILSVVCISLFKNAILTPDGSWDAWSIWNLSAKLMYYDSPFLFSSELPHPDYPLLLPYLVSTGWHLVGSTTPIIPIFISISFTIALISLLYIALKNYTTPIIAMWLMIIFLLPPPVLRNSGVQTADIPFATFLLICVIAQLVYESQEKQHLGWLVISGIAAGLALHTKNEGMLFAPVMAFFIVGLASKNRFQQLVFFLLGIAPFAIGLIYFKITFTPPNDIIAGVSAVSTFDKLLDFNRYITIILFMLRETGSQLFFSLLAIFFVIYDGNYIFKQHKYLLLCVVILIGYGAIYLITPHDLIWHLESSLDRLVVHVWAIWVVGLGLSLVPIEQEQADMIQK